MKGGAFKTRLIIVKPSSYWLSEKPVKRGYWGFVRSKEDYEDEKNRIEKELIEVVEELRKEGKKITLLPSLEVEKVNDVLEKFDDFKEAYLNIVLEFAPAGVWNPGSLIHAIVAASNFVLVFDKFKPNIYAGTLFAPPAIKYLEERGLSGKVFIVEGDFKKLKIIMRVLYSLWKISNSNLVCVGPINSSFGGWVTLKKGMEMFGFNVRFYTYDEFVKDFNALLKLKRKEAEEIVEEFTKNAIKVVEPTRDDLLRAAVYHLVLKKYIEESNADWVTVNCLSELISKTKATPCLSFSMLNDEGYVATCEADPTEMLLHYLLTHISSKPVFFNDPTVNEEDGTLILAHCTSPTKMLGYDKSPLKYEVRTHHESNCSATPKPTYEKGVVTIAGLSFNLDKMIIIVGEVVGSPNLRICRAQVEVKVRDATEILENWQGFHWVMVYGDYSQELLYLCKVTGIKPTLHVMQ